MTWLRIFSIIIFVVIFLLWAGQNLENKVSINNFKGDTITVAPLWIVVLIASAFGMFFMGILGIVQEFRDKSTIKKLNRTVERQQAELSSLRNLPISDDIAEEVIEDTDQKPKNGSTDTNA